MARLVTGLAALTTLTAIFWSSGAPLWIGWRVYTEQILIAALAFALAIAYLTRPGPWPRLSQILALASLGFGGWLAVRFPTLSENVFYHPTEASIVAAIGLLSGLLGAVLLLRGPEPVAAALFLIGFLGQLVLTSYSNELGGSQLVFWFLVGSAFALYASVMLAAEHYGCTDFLRQRLQVLWPVSFNACLVPSPDAAEAAA